MEFKEIFERFIERRKELRVVFVASSDENGQPNCAPKLLVDVVKPNKVFYIDFKSCFIKYCAYLLIYFH